MQTIKVITTSSTQNFSAQTNKMRPVSFPYGLGNDFIEFRYKKLSLFLCFLAGKRLKFGIAAAGAPYSCREEAN